MDCTNFSSCSRGFCFTPHLVMVTATAIFIAILFLQSGWDKMQNRPANLAWLKDHFKNTFLLPRVPLLLSILSVLELLTGTFTAGGLIVWLWKDCAFWLLVGFSGAALSLLCLFKAQRIARDYAGAAALVPYFLVVMLGLWLIS